MKTIPFFKMNGSGNDFIIINDLEETVSNTVDNIPLEEFVRKICSRKVSIGADGVILIKKPDNPEVNFKWQFYNADGSKAEMCGNGSRCAARFAFLNKIAPLYMKFETLAGIIEAQLTSVNTVRVKLPNPTQLHLDMEITQPNTSLSFINTGVPHVVIIVEDINKINVKDLGSKIRYHESFKPQGTNVNFVKPLNEHTIEIRTYERGVEDETFACGTGATASAIVTMVKGLTKPPVTVFTRGGKTLKIYASIVDSSITNVLLEGDALISYIGSMTDEAWSY